MKSGRGERTKNHHERRRRPLLCPANRIFWVRMLWEGSEGISDKGESEKGDKEKGTVDNVILEERKGIWNKVIR